MTNWIEQEEEKKALAEKKRIIESNAKHILDKKRAEDRTHKEEILKNNLSLFFNLCNRIKKLDNNPNSLMISGFQVASVSYKKDFSDFSDFRVISFSTTETDQILIEIRSYQDEYYGGQKMKTIEKMYLSKKILNQDILDWEEEKMINTIRWINSQYDNIKKNLPKENEGLIREENADNENLINSILTGILGGIIGLVVGYIIGYILGHIIWFLKIFGDDIGDKGISNINIIVCGLIMIWGFYMGYVLNRKKY